MEQKATIPTEIIKLPSEGLFYPKESPLSSGQIEMKYMTAQHEDILTNQNYISQGIVLDKLFQALIVSPINYDDLLVGDKNAILVAARILGYGKDYSFNMTNPNTGAQDTFKVDLSQLGPKPLKVKPSSPGLNEFDFVLPASNVKVTFKLITHKEEKKIEDEINGLKKVNSNISTKVTTRLKYTILAVDGNRDAKYIKDFIDNFMLARDSQALRKYIKEITPDLDFNFYPGGDYAEEGIEIPITVDFFWPRS